MPARPTTIALVAGALGVVACTHPVAHPAPTTAPTTAAAPSPPPAPHGPPCVDAAHHAFDFWLGDWDVTVGGKPAGHNLVTSEHGGCVLIEHWQSVQGHTGTSFNYVDPATGAWVQHWLDSDGSDIQLRGGLRDGAMILDGTLVEPGGKTSRLRGTWSLNPAGEVRQLFEQSADDGATWTVWFDGNYRHPGNAPD